jgi:hypothetical protein
MSWKLELAIGFAARLDTYYFKGKFTVHLYTDSIAFPYCYHKPDVSAKISRWLVNIMEFNIEIHHLPGRDNSIADILSRNPVLEAGIQLECLVVESVQLDYETDLIIILNFLRTFQFPLEHNDADKKSLRHAATRYVWFNDYLWLKMPKGSRLRRIPYQFERLKLLSCVHDQLGHFGVQAVYERVKYDFFWPHMYDAIVDYVRSCADCQKFERLNIQLPVQPFQVSNLFQRFGVDIIGPILPVSERGHRYILVFVEYFTRWPEAVPLHTIEENEIAHALYSHLFCVYGPPHEILTDNATSFTAAGITSFIKLLGVRHQLIPAYRQQRNGLVEKNNDLVVEALK